MAKVPSLLNAVAKDRAKPPAGLAVEDAARLAHSESLHALTFAPREAPGLAPFIHSPLDPRKLAIAMVADLAALPAALAPDDEDLLDDDLEFEDDFDDDDDLDFEDDEDELEEEEDLDQEDLDFEEEEEDL